MSRELLEIQTRVLTIDHQIIVVRDIIKGWQMLEEQFGNKEAPAAVAGFEKWLADHERIRAEWAKLEEAEIERIDADG